MYVKLNVWYTAALVIVLAGCQQAREYQWAVHDMSRPRPVVVTPGEEDGQAPSDAVVLFDGADLDEWQSTKGGPARWKAGSEYFEVVPKTGNIQTKQAFGDCQLHIEWATPAEVKGRGQGRGNSGVFLMGIYEVQILDSYNNDTYPDGQAGAIYGQKPPMVNACRGPGKWQSYDIIFRRPIFEGDKLVRPATITVLHNGVLIQDNWVIEGATRHKRRAEYKPHPDKLPLILQDHGNPVRYRNVWIRLLD
ncbi:MAG: DUF1080 domain-containing protein [Planctomycetota bacterium]|nr:MAG: DUF1080 domain-containing protein [Planctomycetota bacterium]